MHVHAPANRQRKCLTLTLPPDLIEQAREQGLNLSRFLESGLKKCLSQKVWCGGRDSNPRCELGKLVSFLGAL